MQSSGINVNYKKKKNPQIPLPQMRRATAGWTDRTWWGIGRGW